MRILAFASILLFISFYTGAQPFRAMASDEDIFIPGSAWLVGSASLTPVSAKDDTNGLPCIAMNQYNNGFIVRISGGGGKIMAMAVDFRQDVFKPNKDYNLNIRIPETSFDANIPARAYNRQSLLFGTQEAVGLYEALKSARVMEMRLGKKALKFAMIGLRDGIDRMEVCYKGEPVYNKEQSVEYKKAAFAGFGKNNKTKTATRTAIRMGVEHSSQNEILPSPSKPEAQKPDSGEDMVLTPFPADGSNVKNAYKEKAIDIDTALAQASSTLNMVEPAAGTSQISDFSISSEDKNTENNQQDRPSQDQRMARSWQAPVSQEKKSSPENIPEQRDVMIPSYGNQKAVLEEGLNDVDGTAGVYVKRWRAIRGSNLREVLDNWSSNTNVRLLWLAGHDFPVKESMILQGRFEEAVLALLEQYEGNNVPVGRIYTDTAGGQRVLLIERR